MYTRTLMSNSSSIAISAAQILGSPGSTVIGSSSFGETTNSPSSTRNSINYYVLGSAVMVVIGITTNILNLIVLSLKSMKSTTNKYLCALAVCDLFVLVLSLITLSNSFSPLDFDSETAESLIFSSIDFDDLIGKFKMIFLLNRHFLHVFIIWSNLATRFYVIYYFNFEITKISYLIN